jgi:hypothetical protein
MSHRSTFCSSFRLGKNNVRKPSGKHASGATFGVAAFTLVLASGCVSSGAQPNTTPHGQAFGQTNGPAPPRDYPGTLRSAVALGADFQWRQQVTAKWPQGTRSFDAVLSKTGDELLLVGLGPMDTPGFVLTLDAKARLDFVNHTGQPARFNPRYVLLDVQRVFYPWFPSASNAGTRETRVDNERVTETWKDGVLTQRTFQRLDNNPPGVIVVMYSGWRAGNRAPERATLKNGWFGYSLTIQTLEQSSL